MRALRRLAPRVALLMILLEFADQGLGRALDALYRGSSRDLLLGAAARPTVAVLGSSRAHRQYDPVTLREALGHSVWNFGQDGQFGPAYQRGLIDLLLARYSPRLVVLDVQAPLFYSGPDDYDRLGVLAPHARESAMVRELMLRQSNWEPVKLLSRIYPFNSRLLEIVNQGRHKGDVGGTSGFEPLTRRITRTELAQGEPVLVGTQRRADTSRTAVNQVDSMKLADIRAMVGALRARGVIVAAVRSPTLLRSEWALARDARQEREMRTLFTTLSVPFIDMSTRHFPMLSDDALFADWIHLNVDGARRFSAVLADSLRPLLR